MHQSDRYSQESAEDTDAGQYGWRTYIGFARGFNLKVDK